MVKQCIAYRLEFPVLACQCKAEGIVQMPNKIDIPFSQQFRALLVPEVVQRQIIGLHGALLETGEIP